MNDELYDIQKWSFRAVIPTVRSNRPCGPHLLPGPFQGRSCHWLLRCRPCIAQHHQEQCKCEPHFGSKVGMSASHYLTLRPLPRFVSSWRQQSCTMCTKSQLSGSAKLCITHWSQRLAGTHTQQRSYAPYWQEGLLCEYISARWCQRLWAFQQIEGDIDEVNLWL